MRLIRHDDMVVAIKDDLFKWNRRFVLRLAIIIESDTAPIRRIRRNAVPGLIDDVSSLHTCDPSRRVDLGKTAGKEFQNSSPRAVRKRYRACAHAISGWRAAHRVVSVPTEAPTD